MEEKGRTGWGGVDWFISRGGGIWWWLCLALPRGEGVNCRSGRGAKASMSFSARWDVCSSCGVLPWIQAAFLLRGLSWCAAPGCLAALPSHNKCSGLLPNRRDKAHWHVQLSASHVVEQQFGHLPLIAFLLHFFTALFMPSGSFPFFFLLSCRPKS